MAEGGVSVAAFVEVGYSGRSRYPNRRIGHSPRAFSIMAFKEPCCVIAVAQVLEWIYIRLCRLAQRPNIPSRDRPIIRIEEVVGFRCRLTDLLEIGLARRWEARIDVRHRSRPVIGRAKPATMGRLHPRLCPHAGALRA